MAGIADVLAVEWAPASDPFSTSPTWVAITGDVENGNIARGRSGAFDLYGVGKANFLVTNSTGGTPVIDPTVWYRWRQARIFAIGSALLSETFTGSDGATPTGWTDSGTSGAGASVQINSNRLRFVTGTTTYGLGRIRYGTALATDIDLRCTIDIQALSEHYVSVYVRGGTSFASNALVSSYSIVCDIGANLLSVYEIDSGGTSTLISSGAITWTAAVWNLRVLACGTSISAKAWTSTEPDGWTVTVEDTTNTGTGIGLKVTGGNNTTSDTIYIDNLEVKKAKAIFRGFVAETRHDQSGGPFVGMATLDAVDLIGILAGYETALTGVPRETTGARINRILDAIGIPSAWRSIADGYIEMAEPDGGVLNVNALQHIQDCAEAEVGGLYASAAGVLTFEDRYELLERLNSAAAYTFSDTPAGNDMRPLRDLVLTPVGTDYRNLVQFIGDSGTAQVASNVPANTPPDALSRTLPIAEDADALSNATILLEVYRQTLTWPTAVTVPIYPDRQSNLDQVTAMDLRTLVAVEHTPVGKTQQTYKTFVESINHRFGRKYWEATLGLSSADRWEDAWGKKNDYLILDDPTYGKLDTGKLAP